MTALSGTTLGQERDNVAPKSREALILQRRALQREKNKGAIALLDQWAKEDETDDPEELARRSQALQDFKAAMNQNRADTGQEPLYCD